MPSQEREHEKYFAFQDIIFLLLLLLLAVAVVVVVVVGLFVWQKFGNACRISTAIFALLNYLSHCCRRRRFCTSPFANFFLLFGVAGNRLRATRIRRKRLRSTGTIQFINSLWLPGVHFLFHRKWFDCGPHESPLFVHIHSIRCFSLRQLISRNVS